MGEEAFLMDLNLYLQQLETLVNIDSGSHSRPGIQQVAEYLARWYEDIGWSVKRHDVGEETAQVLEISNHPDAKHYDVMFIGHMDTVFPDGTAAARPFTIRGDYCYGPGVGDMKNGDLAMYHTAVNADPAVLDKLNICMCYNPDEEIGSRYSRSVTDQIAARSDMVVVMESAGHLGIRHCFRRKGGLGYKIAYHGKAAHAGFMWEQENASAILEMGSDIVKIMGLASRENDSTVNIGLARGGTAGNVVADYAEITVDMRVMVGAERERLKAAMQEILTGPPYVPGVTKEVLSYHENPPMEESPETRAYVEHLRDIAAGLGIGFEEKIRGGGSDGNHLSRMGPKIVLDGMGPHGADDHSERENSYIPSTEPCVRLLCAMLADLAAAR